MDERVREHLNELMEDYRIVNDYRTLLIVEQVFEHAFTAGYREAMNDIARGGFRPPKEE